MNVDILGPLRMTTERGEPIDIAGRHAPAALAYLTLRRDKPVPLPELAAAVATADSGSTRRTRGAAAVSTRTLRAELNAMVETIGAATGLAQRAASPLVVSSTALLTLSAGSLDADRFRTLVGDARRAWAAGDRDASATTSCAALALWRGDPYQELAGCLDALPVTERLRELYLTAVSIYQEFVLVRGPGFQEVIDMQALAAAHPERRPLRLQVARALALVGRQVDALAEMRDTATVLGDSPLTRQIAALIARRDAAIATTPTVGAEPGLPA